MTDMLEYWFEDLSMVTSISSFQGQTGNMSAPSTWTRARYHDGDSLKNRIVKEQPRRQLQQGISHNGIVDMTPQWITPVLRSSSDFLSHCLKLAHATQGNERSSLQQELLR